MRLVEQVISALKDGAYGDSKMREVWQANKEHQAASLFNEAVPSGGTSEQRGGVWNCRL